MQIVSYPGNVYVVKSFFSEHTHKKLFDLVHTSIANKGIDMLQFGGGYALPMLFSFIPESRDLLINETMLDTLSNVSDIDKTQLDVSDYSDFHINALGGWHDDLGNQSYCSTQEAINCKILKAGIFSADPNKVAGVVTQFEIDGKVFRPEMTINDLLIFPTWVKHRGYPGGIFGGALRKIVNKFNIKVPQKFHDFFYTHFGEVHRESIFFTFGLKGEVFSRFCEKNTQRAMGQLTNLNLKTG